MKQVFKLKSRKKNRLYASPIPPLYDENGDLIKDRYCLTIQIPGAEPKSVTAASEWGMMGHVDEAVRIVGDNGRRQVKIMLAVEPGEKVGTLGKRTEYADAVKDLEGFVKHVRLLGEIISNFYYR